jgi:hypothetical protein
MKSWIRPIVLLAALELTGCASLDNLPDPLAAKPQDEAPEHSFNITGSSGSGALIIVGPVVVVKIIHDLLQGY